MTARPAERVGGSPRPVLIRTLDHDWKTLPLVHGSIFLLHAAMFAGLAIGFGWASLLFFALWALAWTILYRRYSPVDSIRISPSGVTISRRAPRNVHVPADALDVSVDDRLLSS